MSEKKKKIYQKWWAWLIVIILILVGISFIFSNEIKAKRLGIDVQYLENPQYCQKDSDCAPATCRAVNIYNFNSYGDADCEIIRGKPICRNNFCIFDVVKIPNE